LKLKIISWSLKQPSQLTDCLPLELDASLGVKINTNSWVQIAAHKPSLEQLINHIL
jgi:hypothetical protein